MVGLRGGQRKSPAWLGRGELVTGLWLQSQPEAPVAPVVSVDHDGGGASVPTFSLALNRLLRTGWLRKVGRDWHLTDAGKAEIVTVS